MRANQLRVAGRIARREVRRHPWRHLLVIGLIFVPSLGVVALFSASDTWKATADRADAFATAGQSGGYGDLVTVNSSWRNGSSDVPELDRSALPEGTIVEDRRTSADWFVTESELAGALLVQAPEDSMASARAVVRSGRLPRSIDEVALSPALARRGEWKIGDQITSARFDRSFDVVGIAVLGDDRDVPAALVGDLPEELWSQPTGNLVEVALEEDGAGSGGYAPLSTSVETGIWLPAGIDPELLRSAGVTPVEPSVTVDDRLGLGFAMAAAGVGAIVAVVASAAFALAARRQLRSVGLLATAGADPATIRASLVLQGALPGLVAGVLAAVAGWAAVAVIARLGLVERFSEVEGATAAFSATGALVALALGVGAGIAAAWQPATTASRIPLLSALAGRRPVGPVRTHVPLAGLALWAVGALLIAVAASIDADDGLWHRMLPFLVIGGVIAVALGGVGLAPLLVALVGRGASRAGGSLRLVLRGLARHRTQSAATVAAVGVALALPVGLLTFRVGEETRACCEGTSDGIEVVRDDALLAEDPAPVVAWVDGQASVGAGAVAVERLLEVLGPEAGVVRGVSLVDGEGDWRYVAEVDDDTIDAFQPWVAEALRAGRAVALDADGAGPLTLVAEGRSVDLTAVAHPEGLTTAQDLGNAAYLVGSDALDGVGGGRPSDWVTVVRAASLTRSERRAIQPLLESGSRVGSTPTLEQVRAEVGRPAAGSSSLARSAVGVWLQRDEFGYEEYGSEVPGFRDPWTQALLTLAVLSSVVALVVLTITLSLRAVDGRDDRRAAIAAGAPPGLLRRQRSMEGGVLAVLGALLALPLGWIPIAAARAGRDDVSSAMLPGWEVVPVLLVPVVLVTVLWWVVPTVGAALRDRRGRPAPDDLLPRW